MHNTTAWINLLGAELAGQADDVEDMARRARNVLRTSPTDHHYAASKLRAALRGCVKALVLAGYTHDQIAEVVNDAEGAEREQLRYIAREIPEDE